jgi:hypothetical protein
MRGRGAIFKWTSAFLTNPVDNLLQLLSGKRREVGAPAVAPHVSSIFSFLTAGFSPSSPS